LGAIGLNSYSSKFSPKAFPMQGLDVRAPGMGRMLPELEQIYKRKQDEKMRKLQEEEDKIKEK